MTVACSMIFFFVDKNLRHHSELMRRYSKAGPPRTSTRNSLIDSQSAMQAFFRRISSFHKKVVKSVSSGRPVKDKVAPCEFATV